MSGSLATVGITYAGGGVRGDGEEDSSLSESLSLHDGECFLLQGDKGGVIGGEAR